MIGINAPTSSAGNNTGYILGFVGTFFHTSVTGIELGSINNNDSFLDNAALAPIDAYYIDKKIDDGNPATGIIQVSRAWEFDSSTICVDTSALVNNPANVNYLFTDTSVSCRLFYLFGANF